MVRPGLARILLACLCLLGALAPAAAAQTRLGPDTFEPGLPSVDLAALDVVPPGFEETIAWSGLSNPTAVRFAPDGRVFVAEKSGVIKVFDNVNDPTATIFADLSTKVHNFWDRGLLGLALDPQFTTGRPFVYALYTHDAMPGGTAPRWGDGCPTPPGATGDGCVVTGRLSKLSAGGVEQVLIEDWCQQYPSHSIGTVAFGADGALYVSSGDGASFNFPDYGQDGSPVNPCGDPPGGVGGVMDPPTAEGGALRSQDIRTSGDPASLDGTILRVNPDTGAAMPDNPNAGSADANVRRIIANGLRNPFRFTMRPGTNDLWLGDVGWNTWEEINRVPSPAAPVENFGWPCYEGNGRMSSYDNLNLNICENLYSAGASAHNTPVYTYNHGERVSTETCPTGGSAIAGLAFYNGGTFPTPYNNALFFADNTRDCIWVMFAGANGLPDPATRQPFINQAANPVDIQVGPGGDLYYADFDGGTIRRVRSLAGNHAPSANAAATPTSGQAPLTVNFDGSGSTDPDGDTLSYAWDLDGDGAFDDSTAAQPSFTYTQTGSHQARLRVRDPSGLEDIDTVTITVGAPPTPTMTTPVAGTTWAVGDVISFSGSATRAGGGAVPASGLSWTVILNHCSALVPNNCHEHELQTFSGVASGSFVAPDHEYPSYLSLELTATDGGLSSTVTRRLDPKTVNLTFETDPAGLQLSVGSEEQTGPFTRTFIQGSTVSLIAPTQQAAGGKTYNFSSWSDGGAAAHIVTAGTTPATYRANYVEAVCAPGANLVGAWGFDETSGPSVTDASGRGNTGSISGATRSTTGKFGSALSFDGVNDVVTVPDSASLDLSSRATLEAWVNPTALGSAWRTVLLKEQPGQLVYALYANNDLSRPAGHLFTTGDLFTNGSAPLPLGTWSHLAMTWDGTTQRLFVNGNQVGSRALGGTLVSSAGALRFGGNSVWAEWFAGTLDEIRIYDRALTQAQLQADMNAPVTCGGPPPQPALSVSPGTLSFTATQGGANPAAQNIAVTNTGGGNLDWTASESVPWLSVSPQSGTAPGNIAVTPSITGLAPGTYTTQVTVTAAGATGSPKTVDVSLTVNPAPPVLAVSRTTMSFSATQGGANPSAQSFDVTNTGGGTINWSATESASWLSLNPSSGTAPATVTATPSIAGLAPGTYTTQISVTAPGVSGSPKTIDVTLTVNPSTPVLGVAPASLTFNATQGGANPAAQSIAVTNTGGGTLSFTASDDQPWLSVSPASGTAPATLSASASIAGLVPGTYTGTITVTAAGASGSPKTVGVTLNVASAPPPGTAPVGAWGFDEPSGPTATDASGRGNNGTITGATRTTSGRFGSALSFDGINDWVTVPDSASLDLSTRATLEAWVNPTALGSAWRTVLLKEQPGQLVYALYANNDIARPSGHLFTTGDLFSSGNAALPLNTWSHLALTWDGTTLRLFVGANQVASRTLTGTLVNGTGPLRFGGNGVWPEWFAGRIDEVRVYDRALTQTELQTDMNAAVSGTGVARASRAARSKAAPSRAQSHRKAARRARLGAKRARIDRIRNPGAFPQYTGLTRHTAKQRP